jgi:hypothetical protein
MRGCSVSRWTGGHRRTPPPRTVPVHRYECQGLMLTRQQTGRTPVGPLEGAFRFEGTRSTGQAGRASSSGSDSTIRAVAAPRRAARKLSTVGQGEPHHCPGDEASSST